MAAFSLKIIYTILTDTYKKMNCNCIVAAHPCRKYNHIEYQKVLEAYFSNTHNITYNTCT